MKLAKMKTVSLTDAWNDGLKIKSNRLANERAEEPAEQTKAENKAYGNYLIQNNPSMAVQPKDEDQSGDISAEEEENALIETGRQYKAWDKIRDDNEVSANRKEIRAARAATQGRQIRAEQRAVQKHNEYMNRQTQQKNQDTKRHAQYVDKFKKMDFDDATANQLADKEMKGKLDLREEVAKKDFGEKLMIRKELDTYSKGIYFINKAYQGEKGKGDNKAAIAAVDAELEKVDKMQQDYISNKNIAAAEQMGEIKKTLNGLVDRKTGQYDFQKGNELAADISEDIQSLDKIMKDTDYVMETNSKPRTYGQKDTQSKKYYDILDSEYSKKETFNDDGSTSKSLSREDKERLKLEKLEADKIATEHKNWRPATIAAEAQKRVAKKMGDSKKSKNTKKPPKGAVSNDGTKIYNGTKWVKYNKK